MLCYILLPRLFLQEPQQSQGSTDSLYETIPGRYRFNYVISEVTHSQISFILRLKFRVLIMTENGQTTSLRPTYQISCGYSKINI